MVKMVLGSSDAQASSVSSAVEGYTNAFTQASQAVSNLAGADTLSGSAYDNVKSYANTVITPLLKGFQLYAEATSTDVSNFPKDYRGQVGDEDLDSETLQSQINAYNTTLETNKSSINSLNAIKNRSAEQDSQISNLETSNTTIEANIKDLQGKLNKLNEFEKNSPGIFKDLASLESDINTGLNQLSEGISGFNGQFTIPKKKDLKWADDINAEFDKATLRHQEERAKELYNQFCKIMDSDQAKWLSEALKFMPNTFIKSLLKSEGFWEILAGVEKKGATGKKAVDLILEGLSKYEGFGAMIKEGKAGKVVTMTEKAWKGLKNLADPVKSAVSEGLKQTKIYKTLAKVAQGDSKAAGALKFLGKGAKAVSKGATVLTYADVAISGISGGAKEFAKSHDVGKAAIAGTFSAVKSVGPLEGATIGAQIGSAVPGIGTFGGAVIGGLIGVGIKLADNAGWIDAAQNATMKGYDSAKKAVGKAISGVKNTVSHALGGIGKAFGFG